MMSSSGSWSMTARATVNPPTPESNTPIGASASLMRPTLVPTALTGLTFRPGQQVRREHPGHAAAQMPLPGHAAAEIEHRHSPPQDSAVGHQHHQADEDLPARTDEEPEHQQEGQPAEDQPGCADVVGLAAR